MISFRSFAPGIAAGILLFIFCAMLLPTAAGQVVATAGLVYVMLLCGGCVAGILAGVLIWLFTRNSSTLKNAFKIFFGNFYSDEKQTFITGLMHGLSKHTWEIFQTALGHTWLQLQNIFHADKRVAYCSGAVFLILQNQKKRKGVTIGTFINVFIKDKIEGDFEKAVTSGMLFMHEYGHTFDSRIYGIFFLPLIGLPSLISAATAKPVEGTKGVLTHDYRWYEMSANRHAARYFKKYYSFDWKVFEDLYPLQKPSDYA